jgi:hypothetical protein
MRALWERVLTERIEMRSARGRTPLAEGDELAMDYLAAAVADVLAGVERPPAFLRREPRQRRRWSAGSTDYVLLIDRSASMSGPAAEAAADAMLILAESIAGVERDIDHAERRTGLDLDLDVRTALIVFDSEAEVVKPLSRGMDDVVRRRTHASVRAPAGSTNDAAALQAAAEQFGVAGRGPRDAGRHGGTGDGRRRVAILVSDGGSNDTAAAERELAGLRAAGVQVHGVGLRTDDLTVRYAPTGARVDDIRRLPDALEAIVEQELP